MRQIPRLSEGVSVRLSPIELCSPVPSREKIRKRIAKEPQLQLLFLESYCDDPAVIAANVALKVQSGDPDYQGMSREEAERDFRRRIDAYERVYQTITEPGISFCRILNVGEQVTMNRIQGYLQSRVAFYLMNLHLKPRSIYLSRVSDPSVTLRDAADILPAWREYIQCGGQDWWRLGSIGKRMGVCQSAARLG